MRYKQRHSTRTGVLNDFRYRILATNLAPAQGGLKHAGLPEMIQAFHPVWVPKNVTQSVNQIRDVTYREIVALRMAPPNKSQ